MNIDIFTWWEQKYKSIYSLSIVFVSAAVIALYFFNRSNDIGVVISIGYALFLFIVSFSISNEKTKLDNKFYLRLKRYITLKKLSDRFSLFTADTRNLEEMNMFIRHHRKFSKRDKDESQKGKGFVISEPWITYTERFIHTEDQFLEAFDCLCKLLSEEFMLYFSSAISLQSKPAFRTDYISILLANPAEYAKENLKITASEVKKFVDHFLKFIKSHMIEIEDLSEKFNNMHLLNLTMINVVYINIKRIENIYGDRIHLELDSDMDTLSNFDIINSRLVEISNNVATYEQSGNIVNLLDEISKRLHYIENRIDTKKF